MTQNKDGADKTVKGEPEKLTGATNRQEFPARNYPDADDAAQQDNMRRVQAVKELDRGRNMLPEQLERLESEKPVKLTSAAGTKVTASGEQLVELLKSQGYK